MNDTITKKANEALNNRLKKSENYSEREIKEVSSFEHKLFSENAITNDEISKLLRNLCASSNLSKSLDIKKSHRPYIGPIIYFTKKILSRVITPFFRIQFLQIENFNRNAVLAIARLYNQKSIDLSLKDRK